MILNKLYNQAFAIIKLEKAVKTDLSYQCRDVIVTIVNAAA